MIPYLDFRRGTVTTCWLALCMAVLAGCTTSAVRLQSPDADSADDPVERIRRVGDYASPQRLHHIKLEAVGLVTGLDGTGSDPAPSSRRSTLIAEMQSREVRHPNKVLASQDTSLVLTRTYLPPAVEKGDRLDVEVRASSRSTTTSLQGGWLMQARLKELAVLGSQIREGHVLGLCEGPVIVNAVNEGSDDSVNLIRGRVLGGGVALKTLPMGLVVREGKGSIRVAQLVGTAINRRFYAWDHGVKRGIATPKTDKYIELRLHPRYKKNLRRYIRVVQKIPVRLSSSDQVALLQNLERQLLDPATAERAAIELEALGNISVEVLAIGLDSADEEVRFHAAMALAYLNDERGAISLVKAARYTSSRRWSALTALAVMDDISVYDHLNEMMHDSSAETRYGAFRTLQQMNPNDPVLGRQGTGKSFYYHTVSTTGEPLVHVTLRGRPEIVIFSHPLPLKTPLVLFAGNRLMVDGRDGKSVKVTRYLTDGEDRHEYCTPQLDDLLRAIEAVGGGYADTIELLHHAKAGGYLDARLAFDAIASPNAAGAGPPSKSDQRERKTAAWPLPRLFDTPFRSDQDRGSTTGSGKPNEFGGAQLPKPTRGFFGRMKGWFES